MAKPKKKLTAQDIAALLKNAGLKAEDLDAVAEQITTLKSEQEEQRKKDVASLVTLVSKLGYTLHDELLVGLIVHGKELEAKGSKEAEAIAEKGATFLGRKRTTYRLTEAESANTPKGQVEAGSNVPADQGADKAAEQDQRPALETVEGGVRGGA